MTWSRDRKGAVPKTAPLRSWLRHDAFDQVCGFSGAPPGERHSRSAVSVVMDEPRAGLLLKADAPFSKWSQPDANRLRCIDFGGRENGQKFEATAVHLPHRVVIVQADAQIPFIRFGDPAQD